MGNAIAYGMRYAWTGKIAIGKGRSVDDVINDLRDFIYKKENDYGDTDYTRDEAQIIGFESEPLWDLGGDYQYGALDGDAEALAGLRMH